MSAHLFVKSIHGEPVPVFAASVFSELGIASHEERESSNYVGGRYYRGESLGVEVIVAVADEPEIREFDYWVSLKLANVWVEDRSFLDQMGDLIARTLTARGYCIVTPERFGTAGGRWLRYSLVDPNRTHGKGAIAVETC